MDSGSARARQYVDDVLSGAVCAPELVRLACQRFIDDLERPEFIYDNAKADAAVENIELLPHVKGRWQGQPIQLEPWQCFWVCSLFGWCWKETGLRRYRYAYVQVPRKNGKSLLAICIALQLFAADNEPGAEVYLGATSQDQARDLLFFPARRIMETCKDFCDHYGVEVNASTLVIPESFSRLKSVIKKPDDGYNPHCAVVDEYHEHDTDDQWSTFDTGMGSREQPLLLTVTTAGAGLDGPCKQYRDDSVTVLQGAEQSDSRFILIYEPDEDDDWQEPATLRKVNPNIGVSVSEAYLLDQLEQAKRSATKQNAFRVKHCNSWVGSAVAWMNMISWQRQKKDINPADYYGKPAYLGLDLASKKDVTALSILIPDGDGYVTFQEFYSPKASAEDNPKYRELSTGGSLTLTDGSATDYRVIEKAVERLAAAYDIKGFAYDQWQANMLAQKLMERNLPMEEVPQNLFLSDGMKEVDALVADGRLWHDGNRCMTWMMGNVMAKTTEDERIKPVKSNPNDKFCKIDGPVALVMAMTLACRDQEKGGISDWLADPVAM